jgi:UDP-N-acetylmuramoyl-tripeptide--D-alanyl-D-alanine ligase
VAGTRTAFIEVECTRTALLALAAALLDEQRRAVRGFRVLAITGSNGKTSTRALASSLVSVEPGVCALSTEGNWNSQIGMPLIVSRLAPFHTHAVLELGISERGDMDELAGCVRPEVVIVTSIAEAHTEGLGGLDGVREQKARIVTSATETLIYPASEKGHAVWTERLPAQAVAWTVGDGVDADFRVARDGALGSVRIESDGVSRELALTVPGGFMGSNLAMAMCGVHALVFEGSATRRGAIESAGAEAALGRFAGPNGRMQRRDVGGWVVLDDTYNANPASVRAGFDVLAELPAPRVAVLGEMKELEGSVEAQHREVGAWARGRADVVVAVGAAMAHAGQAVGADVEFVAAPTVDDALQWFRRRGLSAGTVWVKGSRSSQMERFVAGLEQSVDSEA